jgi:hypothetical protein
VEVKYQFQYPGDTTGIVPEWEAPNGYTQPEFFYTVEVSGVTADSKTSKSKGVMTFEDDIELVLTDDQGNPREDLKSLTIKRPDGQEVTEEPDENGVIRLTDVPPGPFKVVDYTTKESQKKRQPV